MSREALTMKNRRNLMSEREELSIGSWMRKKETTGETTGEDECQTPWESSLKKAQSTRNNLQTRWGETGKDLTMKLRWKMMGKNTWRWKSKREGSLTGWEKRRPLPSSDLPSTSSSDTSRTTMAERSTMIGLTRWLPMTNRALKSPTPISQSKCPLSLFGLQSFPVGYSPFLIK
jgi:hypothetical protein